MNPFSLLTVIGILCNFPMHASEGQTNTIKPVLSATVTERYDDNVMLQNVGPQSGYQSFVTSVLPVIGAKASGKGRMQYNVGLRYAPDFTFFGSLARESYLRQIGLFDMDLTHKDFSVETGIKAQFTDGSTEPVTWGTPTDPGAVPALGATEVRGRRKNFYLAAPFAARQDVGKVFFRGVFDARIWDFMVDNVIPPVGYIIQDYYDRNDLNGGLDVGYALGKQVEAYAGFRLGHQNQAYRITLPSYSYQNTYYRGVLGLSAKASSWLTFNGEIGPSFHVFDASTISPNSPDSIDFLYFLASATVQLSTNSTLKLAAGQHVLPASAGNGVFQNTTASGTLSHKFSSKFQASFGLAYTDYDFFATFTRHDRRLIPEVRLDYAFSKHFGMSGWYAYENAWSIIPDTSDRNYTRSIVGIGFKATY